MKPTPRTDAVFKDCPDGGDVVVLLLDHARDLERQLSDALEGEKALRQELAVETKNSERLFKALKRITYLVEPDKNAKWDFGSEVDQARAAMEQHESGDEPTYTDCPIHGRHEGDCPRC